MFRQRHFESHEVLRQGISRRTLRPAPRPAQVVELHSIIRLQRTIGNLAVGRLIQASGVRRLDRQNAGDSGKFTKSERVAVQSMVAVVRTRSPVRPDFSQFSVQLLPEHKEWILQLWSAATGQSRTGTSTLTIADRHEALASGMRGALRLAARYAAAEQYGKTMQVELHDAIQAVRRDLYAAASKPGLRSSFSFGFVPKILDIGNEPAPARTGSPLSSQPAELREVVYLSFPSRNTPKEPEQWFHDLTDRQKSAFTALYNALRAKDLVRFMNTIHSIDNGEPHFWGLEQEGNTVSLKLIGDTDGLNQRLGDPTTQGQVSLDSPFMSMMHAGQKSYRERTSGPGLHISVGPGKFWDVHLDAHPPVRGQEAESEAELTTRFLMHGLQELFPNMPRAGLTYLLKKVRIPPHIAKQIANHTLPAVRFFPATDSPLWRTNNPASVQALDILSLKQEGRDLTATVGISGHF
jgi:hypothetical protein